MWVKVKASKSSSSSFEDNSSHQTTWVSFLGKVGYVATWLHSHGLAVLSLRRYVSKQENPIVLHGGKKRRKKGKKKRKLSRIKTWAVHGVSILYEGADAPRPTLQAVVSPATLLSGGFHWPVGGKPGCVVVWSSWPSHPATRFSATRPAFCTGTADRTRVLSNYRTCWTLNGRAPALALSLPGTKQAPVMHVQAWHHVTL